MTFNKYQTLEEIASLYTELKPHKKGYLTGLCPLHNDTRPSFFVSESFQTFICFGCQKKGNKYKFLEYMGKLDTDVRDSYEKKTFNYSYKSNNNKSKVSIFTKEEINSSHIFAKNAVYSVSFNKVLKYLESRGVNRETAIKSNIGYIFDHIDIPREIWKMKNKINHLIFPIYDLKNNLVSFSSRSISDKDKEQQKYKNLLGFKKSDNIYFLPFLLKERKIRRKDIFLSEGFFDVLTTANKDIFSISIFGSSITINQVDLIRNLLHENNLHINNLVLSFDNDLAGYICTLETYEKLKIENMKILDWSWYKENDLSDLYVNRERNYKVKKTNIIDYICFAIKKSKEFRNYIKENQSKFTFLNKIIKKKENQIRFLHILLRNHDVFFNLLNVRPFENLLLIACNIDLWKEKVISSKLSSAFLSRKLKYYFNIDIKYKKNSNNNSNVIRSLSNEINELEKCIDKKIIDYSR